ncbi:type II toxin-antitoxin system VapB family antitoxin [Candidatus Regiella insecticola]|uniref:Addiction module n=1 Tax=Candidatus Regiella insecticola TaxID=138073 RepID=A0A6L2ZQI1_9ENTR|nr:type II toxin-antitoxin system VapB family antitoxin [Candidatus Regiella insecticola]GFN46812.1 addiction module [Candidatus Regiella insecticola]
MRTVAIFKNGKNRAIRLPVDMDFAGVNELVIEREGDTLMLKPVRPTWATFTDNSEKADADFLLEREDLLEEGRFSL